jgi:glucose/mannose transport system substrate-binding protein
MRVNVVFMYGKMILLALLALPAHAGEVEVLHYWKWGNDAKALELARASVLAKGHAWKDFTTGYGNEPAISVLRERIKAGHPPTAAQVLPHHAIAQWGGAGVLADLDVLAKAGKWDAVLPAAVSRLLKHEGRYVAAPVYLHRNDRLWINIDILERAGAKAPQTWDQFFETAEAMKRAGFVALAHGAQPWQHLLLFEMVALGTGGVDFYRKALLELDPGALGGVEMERALTTFRRLRGYTGQGARARDWNVASDELAQGRAGMQLMGEWAMPLFARAGRQTGLRYDCMPGPGAGRAFVFALDSFVMFKPDNPGEREAQADFAAALLSPQLQQGMNLIRGSVPPRLGVDLGPFDRCARQSGAAYAAAGAAGTLVPTTGVSVAPKVVQAWMKILNDYWRDPRITPRMAIDRLRAAARPAQ